MIKIAAFDLGKGVYVAFSLNQKYPLSSTIRVEANTSKKEIERVIIERFHSQRNVWRTAGADLERLPKKDGWKITWWPTSVLWSQTAFVEQSKKQVILDNPGIRIEKHVYEQPKDVHYNDHLDNEIMYMAKHSNGGFEFIPLTDDVVPESRISEYMKSHRD